MSNYQTCILIGICSCSLMFNFFKSFPFLLPSLFLQVHKGTCGGNTPSNINNDRLQHFRPSPDMFPWSPSFYIFLFCEWSVICNYVLISSVVLTFAWDQFIFIADGRQNPSLATSFTRWIYRKVRSWNKFVASGLRMDGVTKCVKRGEIGM